MSLKLNRRPIAQQLILATIAALTIVFSVMTLIIQRKADSSAIAVAEQNLEHEAKLMASTLDALFEGIKSRGETQSQFFIKYIGGAPQLDQGEVRVGDVDLPVIKLGNEVLNGNDRVLAAFKALTRRRVGFSGVQGQQGLSLGDLVEE